MRKGFLALAVFSLLIFLPFVQGKTNDVGFFVIVEKDYEPYGEMWYHNNTGTELDFASSGVWYNLTMTNSTLNGFTFNDANDYLSPSYDGLYKAGYTATGDGINNHEYVTTILVNGEAKESCKSHKKMSASNDIITMTGECFIQLNAGDEIKIATMDKDGTGSGTYFGAEVNLVRIDS